ncbi:MAG: class I adenylate-forming enzyme family protein [Halobacteriota archaeon]
MRINTLTIPALFEQAVERTPQKAAIIDTETDERLSYRGLRTQVRAVANGLAERGVESGDTVAICLRNVPEHCITFLATQELGAVAVPFNFRLKIDGVRYTLADSEPTAFVFGDAIADVVAELHPDVPAETLVHVGEEPPPFAISFDELRSDDTDPISTTVTPADRSVIQYSSGTTGNPKGIKLDHLASVTRVLMNSMGQQFRIDAERMLGVMPLYHTVGLHGIFCNMIALSGTYLCQPTFDPERCVETIAEYGVTALHEAPTIFNKLVDTEAITRVDVQSVRVLTYSGAPMDSTLFDRVQRHFDPEYLSNNYGCTEAYGPLGQLNLLHGGSPIETGPANILQETRLVEIGSADPDARVDRGEEGELIVSMDSPTVFSGYLNKPERTAEVVHDGWFFTGDVAYETEDGHTVITGRSDNMIVSGGENIYPTEIEDVLTSHPVVTDVAVVGVQEETWGEVPKAFVTTARQIDSAELDEWCRNSTSLPDFKRPREYEFVDSLPRNPSGKVLRYELREE